MGGAADICAIYRLRSDQYDGRLEFRHFKLMETLRSDGNWVAGFDATAEKEWVNGWFSNSDEISADEVEALVRKWKAEGWPSTMS
jgi:hypothetical protein